MFAWLSKLPGLLKYIPGLGTILGGVSAENAEAEKIRAQAEADDLKGFHRTGRISAAHLWKYCKVLIAVFLAVVFGAAVFVDGAADNIGSILGSFVEAVRQLFGVQM